MLSAMLVFITCPNKSVIRRITGGGADTITGGFGGGRGPNGTAVDDKLPAAKRDKSATGDKMAGGCTANVEVKPIGTKPPEPRTLPRSGDLRKKLGWDCAATGVGEATDR